jgi:hypothetical protein
MILEIDFCSQLLSRLSHVIGVQKLKIDNLSAINNLLILRRKLESWKHSRTTYLAIAKFALLFCNSIKSLNQFVVIEATIGKAFNFLERQDLLSWRSLTR